MSDRLEENKRRVLGIIGVSSLFLRRKKELTLILSDIDRDFPDER